MTSNPCLKQNQHQAILNGLAQLLGDTKTIYLKIKNYHWNASGAIYQKFHMMFESQYADLASGFDKVGDRIRALGVPAPVSQTQLNNPSALQETSGTYKSREIIRDLLEDQKSAIGTARSVFLEAVNAEDRTTADLMIQRIQAHEKTASTLRSLLNISKS
ncbi:MAG: DNA starvation/stationary phase protection protein [Nitrospina sp.]|jgi:starvation-inducible DNA-binding protein|nr:DNA starvation/stationary phase protection protein [Nitrospina sp.]